MSIKKLFLLAIAAVAAIAFAAPSMASAGTLIDRDTGNPVGPEDTLVLEGKVKFDTGGNGVECTAVAHVVGTESDETLNATSFSVSNPTEDCKGFGVLFASCTVHTVEPNTPWDVHVEPDTTFNVTDVEITGVNTGCIPTHVLLQYEEVKLTPVLNEAGGIVGATVSGEGGASINGGPALANAASGSLTVTDVPGTYGFTDTE